MDSNPELVRKAAEEIASSLIGHFAANELAGSPDDRLLEATAERVLLAIGGFSLAIEAADYFPRELRRLAHTGGKVFFRVDRLINGQTVVGHWEGAGTGMIDVEAEIVYAASLHAELSEEVGRSIASKVVNRLFRGEPIIPGFATEKVSEITMWLSWLPPVANTPSAAATDAKPTL